MDVIKTSRYKISVEEISEGGPGGYESVYLAKEGDRATDGLYGVLNGFNGRLLPAVNKTVRQRNGDALENALKTGKPMGIASGFKPSGAYHFGHRLTSSTLAFFQKNGVQVFVPVADVECQMAKEKPEQYMLTAADNLLDWGANGVNLDAAHVYFQSEENRVFTISYKIAPKLNFGDVVDIYGAKKLLLGDPKKGKPAEFPFIFSGITQVADILLPQHTDFGNELSFMVSGQDQDGHMKMTMLLTGRTLDDEIFLEGVKAIPSAFYIPHVRGLRGDKASSSDPKSTLYLGAGKPVLHAESGKIGWEYDLSLDDRISRSIQTMGNALRDDRELVEKFALDMVRYIDFFNAHSNVSFNELSASSKYSNLQEKMELATTLEEQAVIQSEIDNYLIDECKAVKQDNIEIVFDSMEEALKEHQKRRQAVFNYSKERSSYRPQGGWSLDDDRPVQPGFWKIPERAAVDEAKRNKTRWFDIISAAADKIVP